jgi:hypothetical protein
MSIRLVQKSREAVTSAALFTVLITTCVQLAVELQRSHSSGFAEVSHVHSATQQTEISI